MKLIERFIRKADAQLPLADPVAAPLLIALEPRIMFDASVGAVAQDAAQSTAESTVDSTSKEQTAQQDRTSNDGRLTQNTQDSRAAQRQEVVFVDGQVGNVQQLLAGLAGNAEIVVLDPTKDGLQQMADYLQGREALDAVHLLSHGADGTVQAGNLWLASSNLAEHRAALEGIGAALKADGDLMIYGCRVGDSSVGQNFIEQLASITGADVAASTDDTGSALLGGNWTLERNTGAIETSALTVDGYEGVLVASWSTSSTAPFSVTIGAAGRTVVGDFDGDGDADILYQTAGNGSVWAYARSNGDGTFTQLTQAQSPFAGLSLPDHNNSNYFVADFDGDGDVDLLVGVNGTQGSYFRNDAGAFVVASNATLPTVASGSRMVVGDFDGDGDADILYQSGGNGSAWGYARSNGNGTFTLLTQAQSPFSGLSLVDNAGNNYFVSDFDGDGDLDVLATVSGQTGSYYRNNGNGTFSSLSTSGFPTPLANGRVVVGDFDADGSGDILYQTGGNGTAFQFAKSNGDGTFTITSIGSSPFAGLSLNDHTGANYRVGDFDGDGDLDLFSATNGSFGALYLQNGSAPELVASSPADNATNVSPNANITLTFSESVTKGAGTIDIVRLSDNTIVESIPIGSSQVTGSGTTWTIDPSVLLEGGVGYAVRVGPKAFVDADGAVFKGISNNTTLNFTVAAVAAPVIGNLNGDSVTYVEKSAYALLDAGSNATVTDADSASFSGGKLTVQVTAGGTSGEDVLFIRDQGAGANQIVLSGASVLYNGLVLGTFTGGSNGNPLVITLTSNATAATVTALIHNLAYRNSNTTEPSTTVRSVSISMDDGAGGSSTVSVVSVAVASVNDAPSVSVSAANPTYTENTAAVQLFSGATINTVESGQKVAQITFTVTNVANGAAEKLVIDGSDVALVNGNSVVTTNNGTQVTVSVVSGTATVILSSSAGLDTSTAQTIVNTLAYRNDSDSPNTANRVVTLNTLSDNGGSANGGLPTTAVGIFSTVSLVSVNDAPVLSGGPYSLPSITEDTTATGMQVSTLLANYTVVDADAGALSGIAVVARGGNGTWQYSSDNANWTDFGAVSNTSALLLSATTYLRYVPDGANGETASFTFRGWDQTQGNASVNGIRSTADTSSNGGASAFSSATAVANQGVTSVNDAPVMTPVSPSLSGLTDTAVNNGGNTVQSLLGGVTDVDTGALKGMAVTGLTGTYGKWQYSLDAGSTWNDVGVVSSSAALLLTAQNLVRFVPDGIHGETATITYKAWDQSSNAGLQGSKVSVLASGGTSAYSMASDSANVVVTAVNDAPVVTVSGTPAAWIEGNNVPSSPIAVDPALTLADTDGPNPLGATARLLTYYSAQDSLSFINDGVSMGNIVGVWNVGTGTLTLTSAGNQATVEQFQAALRAVSYNNASDNPNSTTRTVQFIVTDGGNLASAAVTRDITITAVNDSPVITAVAALPIIEDTPTALSQISFSDVDSTLGIVTFSVASGTLSATGAGGVTVGGTSTALTLSGTLANINLFIANNRLVFTPAANASGDVQLTINVNTLSVSDATTSLTLQVAAVNDAPVVTAPASITVTEDVASVISGISFSDVDAGASTVTATFSVPSGTLSASSGLGVTVGGADTGVLTLSGSLADINLFIAANSVTFKTTQDATNSVILTVTLDDSGNTGGPAQTDSKTVTLNVNAVNDAPVNNLPVAQTAQQGIGLGFNTANGNAISISDVDAGNGLLTVFLSATNGTLSLGSLSGITLLLGTGTNNPLMIFEGTRANLNAALQTLTFTSASNFIGSATLTIETNDNGNSGSGGAKTDIDTLTINVIPLNPRVTSVSAQGLDRTVKVGDEVLINVVFDQVVNADTSGGVPSLLLETGLVDRAAVYLSGSGSNTLVFKYTVQAGDVSADLDFQSTAALQLNGAILANASNDLAVLTLPSVGASDSLGGRSNIVVDGVLPRVASVQAPSDGTYITGQNLDFTVNFSEQVVLDTLGGVPRIAVTLDNGGTVYADYVSGSGSTALVFRMTVANGQLDSNGITVGSSIELNGGAIRDLAGNTIVATLNNVASTAAVNVDGVVPTVVSVAPPLEGHYKAGDVLTFTVNASEAVQTGALAPRLALDVGGVTRYASYVSGSGTSALVFQYIVQAGDNDSDGIAVSSLDLRGQTLTDLAGNDLNLALNGVGSTAGVHVDTTAPGASSIVRIDASPNNASSVRFSVTFSEAVSGVDASDFNLIFGGSAAGSISSVTSLDGRTYTVLVDGLSGQGSLRLDLAGSGTGIVDAAGNAVSGGLTGASYSIDRIAPSVVSVQVPANGTYVAGQNLDFIVNTDEAVLLDTSTGTPRLQVTLDNGVTAYANYLSGAGSTALVFRLTVVNGQLDSNGITLGNSIELNGATLRDSVGNAASTALVGVGDTSLVRIDAVSPTVASVQTPADGNYQAGDVLTFTVNASEAVQTGALAPRLALDVGGVTRYANYVSGSGTSALVFQYIVQAGDNDSDGIAVSSLDLRGQTLTDLAGNDLNLALNGVGSTAGVHVDTTAPGASSIVRLDASPNNASSVRFSVTFSEAVSGVDASDFNLIFGGSAAGSISSVTSLDGRTYTVLVDGLSGQGSLRLDLAGSGTGIVDAAGNAVSGGLTGASYSIDRIAPSVVSVQVPANGTYVAGQNLDFIVNTDEAVLLDTSTGTPRLQVTLDNGVTAYANYLSGAGSTALVFRLTVVNGQLDSNGITLGNSIELNGATLRDSVGNDASTALVGVGDTSLVRIDAVSPTVASVQTPADGNYKAGDVLTFTVNASEAVQTGALAPRLALDVGGVTRYANYVSGSGTSALVFQYIVQAGDNDSDGIAVSSLDLRGQTLTDLAGNDLNLALNGVGSTAGVHVDTTAPGASSIVRIDASPNNASSVRFSVTFSEAVSGVDASDFNLIFGGSAAGSISSVTSLDGRTYTVLVDGLSGQGSLRLDLAGSGTGIVDAAGNAVSGGLTGASYSIDRVAPSVVSVQVPANGTYVAGQNLDFIVNTDEAVLLDTSTGTPRLQVTLDNGVTAYANYLSGAGSTALVFRLTVVNGQLDSNGITLGNSIELNGATLRDSVGNAASTALAGVGDTSLVRIDAVPPTVASVQTPADGNYQAGDVLTFTVNASEAVQTGALAPRLALDVGGVTRYANYVSGSGTSALVFQYIVQAGDNDSDGIAVSSLDLRGQTLTDLAGNNLNLALNGVGSTAGVHVDTTAPGASSIVRIDASPNNASSVRFSVTFSETVSGVDASDFNLIFGGSAAGSISSVTSLDGRTYTVLVDGLSGQGSLRLDLAGSGTGIVDAAGNAVSGGLTGASYSIDRIAPSVVSVQVPANGTYVAGQNLDFIVNTDEAVLVNSSNGNPRLAITLDDGQVAYADYVSTSGGTALLFRLSVTRGMAGNSSFAVAPTIDLNGGSLRDTQGNDANTGLNNLGDTRGILVDAKAPQPSSIVVDGPVSPGDRTLSFTLTFDEAVSGVDASDFSVLGSNAASGVVQSVQQLDGRTYRIVVGDLRGQGSLALSLNAANSGVQDSAGNALGVSMVGQAQSIQTQDAGDLEYRLNPPQAPGTPQAPLAPPRLPAPVIDAGLSPLLPPPLFDVRSVGGDLRPLGTIFLGNASSAPSFIAQVFGTSDRGFSGLAGSAGMGGGEGGVFGSSTLASLFSQQVPGVTEMNVFNGSQWKQSDLSQGLRGVFGAPTFGQQLQQINEIDQRHVRELAKALAQPTAIGQRA
ncbi:DUF4347 domain-containing protein [Pseudomonas promysalinigenes]|uniref:DUF4347 domain-containing protein n=1 Tax=Pseudomonas promysalinigenes TaxID=485898 RepID=UPI001C3E1A32|nr:DUF4347 domain-containing protein [Pseudomonas promysalinigenes]QXI32708.1 DUF4347 domain-containing protein [Pseudomonas promysalinigenes]